MNYMLLLLLASALISCQKQICPGPLPCNYRPSCIRESGKPDDVVGPQQMDNVALDLQH